MCHSISYLWFALASTCPYKLQGHRQIFSISLIATLLSPWRNMRLVVIYSCQSIIWQSLLLKEHIKAGYRTADRKALYKWTNEHQTLDSSGSYDRYSLSWFKEQQVVLLEFHSILIKRKNKNQSAGEWCLADTLIYRKRDKERKPRRKKQSVYHFYLTTLINITLSSRLCLSNCMASIVHVSCWPVL